MLQHVERNDQIEAIVRIRSEVIAFVSDKTGFARHRNQIGVGF